MHTRDPLASRRSAAFVGRRPWCLPERLVTPEALFLRRRDFLAGLGLAGLTLACGGETPTAGETTGAAEGAPAPDLYPAPPNPAFGSGLLPVDRDLTDEFTASRYNNFYEFSGEKDDVWKGVRDFTIRPWSLVVDGLVRRPRTADAEDWIRSFPLEERVYRFRCVEAWAMVVPWTGFPLRRLLEAVEPLAEARFVRFESFDRPEQAPGRRFRPFLPWPYTEGLSLAEATNELAFVATGIYGHPLPKQHGAPLRVVLPWKYGFKGAKSIARISLTADPPKTFWNTLAPDEYDFVANVDPAVPHPRWSQAHERLIDTGERRPTLPYNGYGEWVASLYP
jgi:sulfoxide reductase catalytic subunit YedY